MLRTSNQEDTQPAPVVLRGTMTEDEAGAVVALWSERKGAQETTAPQTRITDVADALDITPEDTQRLLDEVRATRARAVEGQRRLRRRRGALSALACVGLLWGANVDFAPDTPTLTVASSQTRPLSAGERPGVVADTRTDVVLQYHPHTLLRFVLGPGWSPFVFGDTYLTDAQGRRYRDFPTRGGGREGFSVGWLHLVGFHTYSIGYGFPGSQVPLKARPIMLHTTVAADGRTVLVDVPVGDISASP